MTTEKMTIHKALCELKTLDARIKKGIESGAFVFANKHSVAKVSGLNISSYCAEIRSAYQSVTDLMVRRDAIKRAVVLSNAMTKVAVGGAEYTVAEAIEMKNHGIPLRHVLLNKLRTDNSRVRMEAEQANKSLDQRADEYIKTLYANADMKNLTEEIKRMRSEFVSSQTVEVIDPIGITSEIERLEASINSFMVEIDSALSVSNALTEITIEY